MKIKPVLFGFILAIGMPALGLVLAYSLGARPASTAMQAATAASPAVPAAKTEAPHEWATPEQKTIARRMIVADGYKCETVEHMIPFAWSGGWHVWCERYGFELEDHGGKWSVTAK